MNDKFYGESATDRPEVEQDYPCEECGHSISLHDDRCIICGCEAWGMEYDDV